MMKVGIIKVIRKFLLILLSLNILLDTCNCILELFNTAARPHKCMLTRAPDIDATNVINFLIFLNYSIQTGTHVQRLSPVWTKMVAGYI